MAGNGRDYEPRPWSRAPSVAKNAMVACSEPLATRAGLRMLEGGGNAVDAALSAAAVLSVTEPMSTGIGGDVFAIIYQQGEVWGLDAAGPAPETVSVTEPATAGPNSVNLPGAVAGWQELLDRFGSRTLGDCLAEAIGLADEGYASSVNVSRLWHEAETLPSELGPPPDPGSVVRMPDLAATMRAIAEEGATAFYSGRVADAITESSWLSSSDLAAFQPKWVDPIRLSYRGVDVVEMPPPTQGVAALEALGILSELGPGLRSQIIAACLSLEDAAQHVRDGADASSLLDPTYLKTRSNDLPAPPRGLSGGTVYLSVVDADRMAVSFIQSLYDHGGSGVVAPGTGVILNNRAACFEVQGEVVGGTRPYHTLVPGLLIRDDKLWGPFGIMGGFIQAQAHLQFVSGLVDDDLDPQAALDRPRFKVDGNTVLLEHGLWEAADEVREIGLEPVLETSLTPFGGGQAILCEGEALFGGSDRRKDGYAAGF